MRKFQRIHPTLTSFACISLSSFLLLSQTSCSSTFETVTSQVETQNSTETTSKSTVRPESTGNSTSISADSSAAKIECESISPNEVLYDLNSNLALIPNVYLDQTAESRQIHDLGGTGCQLTNLSTNSNIEIAIVKLTNESSITLKQSLEDNGSLSPVSLPKDTMGFFGKTGFVGQTQFVLNNYWVSISSTDFINAIDTTTIASMVISGI